MVASTSVPVQTEVEPEYEGEDCLTLDAEAYLKSELARIRNAASDLLDYIQEFQRRRPDCKALWLTSTEARMWRVYQAAEGGAS